jgi:PadR family transcriptional regulator, regulatory protein PadR
MDQPINANSSHKMTDLTLNESVVLLSVLRLKDKAYGVAIREDMAKISGGLVSYGTLYSYLDQLFRKGFLSKYDGEPTPQRGGRRKIYHRLTPKGRLALKDVYEMQKALVDEIGNWVTELS